MKTRTMLFTLSALVLLLAAGCEWFDSALNPSGDEGGDGGVTVTPSSVTLAKGDTFQFSASGPDSYSSHTWSLSGQTGSSNISRDGLLTVGADETAAALTVRAKENYGDASGTAAVTVASAAVTPQGLWAEKPGPSGIKLSWDALDGAEEYTVYRSVNNRDFSQLARVNGTTYTDTAVTANSAYAYRVAANGVNSAVSYSFAAEYFAMPLISAARTVPLRGQAYHYYRFPVKAGQQYTIEWQNGNGGEAYDNWTNGYGIHVSAWENSGTELFNGATNGKANPKIFTAKSTGFVSVRVNNGSGDTAIDHYQIYCYTKEDTVDTGTVALPPPTVSGFKVSSPSSSSITLAWDNVPEAVSYIVYRANTQTGAAGQIGTPGGASFVDSIVPGKGPYWYTVSAVNADGREGCRIQGAFGFAATHYQLTNYSSAPTLSLYGQQYHYYRLPVIKDTYYTIEWQNGSGGEAYDNWANGYGIHVSAWQPDGTNIFSGATGGKANPRNFRATVTGFVTIEVSNGSGDTTSYNYQIYYY